MYKLLKAIAIRIEFLSINLKGDMNNLNELSKLGDMIEKIANDLNDIKNKI